MCDVCELFFVGALTQTGPLLQVAAQRSCIGDSVALPACAYWVHTARCFCGWNSMLLGVQSLELCFVQVHQSLVVRLRQLDLAGALQLQESVTLPLVT